MESIKTADFSLALSNFQALLYFSHFGTDLKPINLLSSLVLILAGMEIIFSIVSHMVVLFGFVTTTTLIIHPCFNSCWAVLAQHKGLPCFCHCSTVRRLGVSNRWEGDTARRAVYPNMYSLTNKIFLSNNSWGKEGEGGCSLELC